MEAKFELGNPSINQRLRFAEDIGSPCNFVGSADFAKEMNMAGWCRSTMLVDMDYEINHQALVKNLEEKTAPVLEEVLLIFKPYLETFSRPSTFKLQISARLLLIF